MYRPIIIIHKLTISSIHCQIIATYRKLVVTLLVFQMYEEMYQSVTSNGVTIDKCIQNSIDNQGTIIGLIAGDEECYDVSIQCTNWAHDVVATLNQRQ